MTQPSLESEPVNLCAHPPKRSWYERLLARLFPVRLPPDKEPSFSVRGYIRTDVITYDWKDRLRTLVSGHLKVQVATYTENEHGNVESVSSLHVERPGLTPPKSK